jgi:hypothetical protein
VSKSITSNSIVDSVVERLSEERFELLLDLLSLSVRSVWQNIIDYVVVYPSSSNSILKSNGISFWVEVFVFWDCSLESGEEFLDDVNDVCDQKDSEN